jgi:biotin carboxyl carrier protein
MAVRQVLSHLPGIFYQKPSPDEPVFKAPGDAVAAGDTIGLIEIMKSFNEAKSEVSGKLIRYLVKNGEEIAPGQALAEIEG